MMSFKDKLSSFPKDARVEVGITTPVTYPNGTKIAYIASIQAHGTEDGRIPPRDFKAACSDDLKEKQKNFVIQYVRNFFRGKDTDGLVEELGITSANLLRTSVIEFKEPPNAPSTIKRKGFDDPLIETGLLRDTIDWRKI